MVNMRAVELRDKNPDGLVLADIPRPDAGPGQAVVKLAASALNHRDVWITRGLYAGIKLPVVLGSDGCGTVAAVGDGVDSAWLNREVVINPSLDWGDDQKAQGASYRILGMPDNGTFAEYVVVPAAHLFNKPGYLSREEAAAIPLAGLTAYRALFAQGRLTEKDTVLITGIGGGVAALGLQMAVAAGARVVVTSGSKKKLKEAEKLGAVFGIRYLEPGWSKTIKDETGGVDLALDGAGGPGFGEIVNAMNPGGRIVVYGATAGMPDVLDLRKVFWKQLMIQGSTMGSPKDFSDMIDFFEMNQIHPVIDRIFPLEQTRGAFDRMADGKQFGKIVIALPK